MPRSHAKVNAVRKLGFGKCDGVGRDVGESNELASWQVGFELHHCPQAMFDDAFGHGAKILRQLLHRVADQIDRLTTARSGKAAALKADSSAYGTTSICSPAATWAPYQYFPCWSRNNSVRIGKANLFRSDRETACGVPPTGETSMPPRLS